MSQFVVVVVGIVISQAIYKNLQFDYYIVHWSSFLVKVGLGIGQPLRVCLIDLIPEKEYKRLLLKIIPARIITPSEYKHCFKFTSKEKCGGHLVYSYCRIASIECARSVVMLLILFFVV